MTKAPWLRKGRLLWEQNRSDWHLPLSRAEKLRCGAYLILHDYAEGRFPPRFPDRETTHEAEIVARSNLPGCDERQFFEAEMRKPFLWGDGQEKYLGKYLQLCDLLARCEINPPARLLELGCGSGWMAEFLATSGFEVVATTIGPADVEDAKRRVPALVTKGATGSLDFRASAMEEVDEAVRDLPPFDAVFVFEALHHAFAWREAIDAASRCLAPGGWLLLCDEPNWLHTFVSYRVARLSNTHEIGFTRGELRRHLHAAGFGKVVIARNRLGFLVRPHWLAAQR
jgi:2-polyprenyl-3-methyl-5-hydroxy-6-metoxy-1,4-benzoquinol methylase